MMNKELGQKDLRKENSSIGAFYQFPMDNNRITITFLPAKRALLTFLGRLTVFFLQ